MFSTLDTFELGTVTGAGDPPNRDSGKINVGVTTGKTKVGVQGEYERTRTDYAKCLTGGLDRGWSPEQITATCGRPPGAK